MTAFVKSMATAVDVAAFIRASSAPAVDRLKLQKLLSYAQVWSLVWRGAPLFSDEIEAWVHGPVVRAVYDDEPGEPAQVSEEGRSVVDVVLNAYARHSGAWLRELTHREGPWRQARRGLAPDQRSNRAVAHDDIRRSYKTAQRFVFEDSYLRGLEPLVETPEDELEDLVSLDVVPAEDFPTYLESGDECASSR